MLICPDIHGRDFYKPLLANKEDKIIFLGDYEDPYSYMHIDVLLVRMREIFEFAKNNSDRVILLIGNHSFYYYMKLQGNARYDFVNASRIQSLYDEYRDLFKIAYFDEETQTVFSHAGISMEWLQQWNLYESQYTRAEHIDLLNSLFLKGNIQCFNQISFWRGGYDDCGSPIWAHVQEHYGKILPFTFQIFGHSQLNETGSVIRQNNWIMCDSRCLFKWDGENFEKYLEN